MQFEGDLLLDAPLSRTVTGYKSVLLRAIDPLFRRGGKKTRSADLALRARSTSPSSNSTWAAC